MTFRSFICILYLIKLFFDFTEVLFMLDKSLVYKDIVMCLPFEDLMDLKVPVLPDG